MSNHSISSFWHNFYNINATIAATTDTSTTITNTFRPRNMLGDDYHVESKIKFIDSPFSASNVQSQRGGEENYYHHDNNNSNSNMSTIYHFPITTKAAAASSSALYQTTTTTTPPTLIRSISNNKLFQDQQENKKYARIEDERQNNQFDFVPTWYPYVKSQQQQQHNFNNFFTIEDAITPYKPIEPYHAYQPYSYDSVQTEQPLSLDQTGFSPLQDIYHNTYSLSPLPSLRTTTSSTTTTTKPTTFITTIESDKEKELTTTSNLELDLLTTITPAIPTKINNKLHLITEEAGIIDEPSINNRSKLRAISLNNNYNNNNNNNKQQTKNIRPTRTTKKPKNKNYSFFDDWFSSATTESTTENNIFDILITTTTSTPIPTTLTRIKSITTTATTNELKKLPKYNMKMRRTTQAPMKTRNTTIGVNLINVPSTDGTVGKKLRKKYTTYKNNRQQQQLTRIDNLNLTTTAARTTIKGNKKLITKRIKKVIRLRSTLMPILKLKNNSINKNLQKPLVEETEIQTTVETTSKHNTNNNDKMTFTTIAILPETLTKNNTTSTTTAMPFIVVNEKTRSGNRKRGRYTFNNQQQQQQQQQSSIDNNFKRNSFKAIYKQEMNNNNKTQSKLRNYNSRQRSSHHHSTSSSITTITPITTYSTTTWPISLPYESIFKWPASSTAESAIMKIVNNASSSNNIKHKTINILQNLQLSPAPETTQEFDLKSVTRVTEFPPLPIELYFQKMTKSSFE